MILIAEPVHFGATHVQVNSAFIALFKDIYKNQKLDVYAEEKHIAELKQKLVTQASSIYFDSFKQYNGSPSFSWLRKIFGEWHQIIKVLFIAKKQKPELLVWLCVFPTGHWLLALLHRLFLPRQKQLIILHGELVYLGEKNRNFGEHFLKFFLIKAFKISKPSTRYIVFAEVIKKNLTMLPSNILSKISVLRHPFLYSNITNTEYYSVPPLKVCLFGALTLDKNAQYIFQIAQRFEKEIAAGQIQFSSIGKMQPNVKNYQNRLVACHRPDDFLSQSEFEQQIAQHHLALFFYDNQTYSWSASGALHEALSLKLPIISLQNEYFAEVLNQFQVGEIAVSLDEMERMLHAIMLQPEKKLKKYQESIIMFLQQNSFLLQTEKLRNTLKAVGFLNATTVANTND